MKLYKASTGLFLAFVIAFSFVALLQQQKEVLSAFTRNPLGISDEKTAVMHFSFDALTFPVLSSLENTVAEKTFSAENFTRTAIYSFIETNPGVQFRGICSGLGLSIVRKVIELYHGTIKVDSTPELGTVFTVRLPKKPSTIS